MDVDVVWQVLFYLILQDMMLKKMENKVGARTHFCLMMLEMGRVPNSDPLCFS